MSIVAETINFLLSTGNSGNTGNEPGKTEEKAQKAVPILGKRIGNTGNNPQKIRVSENFNPDDAGGAQSYDNVIPFPQILDLGSAMLKRDGCEGHKWSDYYPSKKVRVAKIIHDAKEIQE